MAFDPITLTAAAVTAVGTVLGGIAANEAAGVQAENLNRKAEMERAVAAQKAKKRFKELNLVMGRQRAVAADSGGGTDTEGILALSDETVETGGFNVLNEIYSGEVAATGAEAQASVVKAEGKNKLVGSFISAVPTVLGGFKGFGSTFDMGSSQPNYVFG
jgi:hypothetical protein